jgi:hypothetical protein
LKCKTPATGSFGILLDRFCSDVSLTIRGGAGEFLAETAKSNKNNARAPISPMTGERTKATYKSSSKHPNYDINRMNKKRH